MENEEKKESKKRDFLLPGSILIAALLISISLVWSVGKKTTSDNLTADLSGDVQGAAIKPVAINIKPVSETDHIFGNIEAPVKVIEFSDLECPYCKVFHLSMKEAVSAYNGDVVWVYRHYPIDQLHSKARKEAEATECAAELGGNQAFWVYVDRLLEITPSNNGLDLNKLPQIAEDIDLDRAKFEACFGSGKYAGRVADDAADAREAGARGTPYSVVIAKDGKKYLIEGALPFEDPDPNRPSVKKIIDRALQL